MVSPSPLPLSAQPAERTLLSTGRPDAISSFYAEHVDDILRYFYRRTRDPEVAADLTSETFARLLANRGQFDARRGSEAQWLYGIAKNQLRDFWRKRKVSMAAQDELQMRRQTIDHETAAELGDAVVDEQFVLDSIDGLSSRYRAAVTLRVIHDFSYEQIGGELGCSEGAARVRVFRGLKKLEAVFDDH